MRKENGEKGFTLAELMITVAIIGVLAAVSFIAVAGHQKKLRLLEMDNTAREIFNAAQNHLTQSKSNGLWDKLVDDADAAGTYDESQWGIGLAAKPSDGVTEASGTHSYRRIIVSNGSCISDKGSGVFKLILPYGSVDDTVNHGSYTIEYDINTAQIYAVFYTDSVTSPKMTSGDIDTIYSHISDADYRKSYKMGGSAKGVPVGYYGGATVAEQPSAPAETAVKELQPIKAEIKNGSRLLLCITDPNKDFNDKYLTVVLHGKKAGADAAYTLADKDKTDEQPYLDNEGTVYTYILDSAVIESSAVAENALSRHFSRFGFDAGTDVYAEVTLSLKDESQKVSSTSNTENSLFEKYDSAKGTAQIANTRHLENVSYEISKAEVKNAVLNADISWSANYNKDKIAAIGFLNELGGDETTYAINTSSHIIDPADGSKASTAKYVGIASTSLHTFDGRGHTVANLPITSSKGTLSGSNAGLISDVSWAAADSDKTLTISNLKLVNANIKDTDSGDNGILFGSFDGGGQSSSLTIKKVDITDPVVTVTGSANAAGLLGHSGQGAVKISNSSIIITGTGASDSGVSAQNGNAGGFIGYVDNASNNKITLTNNSITDTTSKENNKQTAKFYVTTKGTAGNAGGIIGSAVSTGKDIAISMFNASAGTITISAGGDAGGAIGKADVKSVKITTTGINGGVAGTITGGGHQGGLAGSLSATGTTDVEDSFASLLVTTDTGDATGGLIGLVSGNGSAVITRCYAAGRTTAGAYAADIGNVSSKLSTGGSVGGLVGVIQSVSSCSITDSYTTCSVSSASTNAASGIGGLLGASTAPVSISNSYTTALVITGSAKAGRFIGICSNTITAAKTNYYLSGINDTVKAVSGDGNNEDVATKAYSATTGSPFSVDEGTRKPALPYDTKLASPYPYMTISQLNSLSASPATLTAAQLVTDNSHVGDWTTGKSESRLTFEKQFALLYYEIVQSGSNKTFYYHCYAADAQAKNTAWGSYEFKEFQSHVQDSEHNVHGFPTGHNQYVAESGYLICIDDTIANQTKKISATETHSIIAVDFGGNNVFYLDQLIDNPDATDGCTSSTVDVAAEKNRKLLVKCNSFGKKYGIDGYNIYRINTRSKNPVDIRDRMMNTGNARHYTFNFTTDYDGYCNTSQWRNKTTFMLNPYFSDMLSPDPSSYSDEDIKKTYIRSAEQFSETFGEVQGDSMFGAWKTSGSTVTQELDISYSENDVNLTLYGVPLPNSGQYNAYITPTINEITGEFTSEQHDGTQYVLKHVTNPLVNTIQTTGKIDNIHITDVKMADTSSLIAKQNSGEFSNITIDEMYAPLTPQNLGTIQNIKIGKYDDVNMQPLIDYNQGSISYIATDTAGSPIFGSTNGGETIDNIKIGTFNITRDCPRGLLIQDSGGSTFSNIAIGNVIFGNVTLGLDGYSFGIISNLNGDLNGCVIGSITDSTETVYKGTSCGVIGHLQKQGIYGKILNLKLNGCTLQGDISQLKDASNQGAFGIIGWNEQGTITADVNGGYISNVSFSGLKSSEVLKDSVGIIGINYGGAFSGYSLNNIRFSGIGQNGGSIIGTNDGWSVDHGASDITVSNYVTDGNGFVGNSINNAPIKNCSIVNAQIAKNGFAGSISAGTISGCRIYSDWSSYNPNAGYYYKPNEHTTDTTAGVVDPIAGYNMVTVGLAENADPLTTAGTGSYGGLVGSATGGTISDCSFTGKVYGKSAAGFANESSAAISNCYANAIVTATDADGAAAGFVRQVSGGSINRSHSVGMIISKGTAGTGAGFAGGTNNSSIKNSYSAVWNAQTTSSYCMFANGADATNYYLNPITSTVGGLTITSALPKTQTELAALVSDANIGITGTIKDKTPTVKYGQYNTDTADTKYPYPVPDQSYYYYGDWK